MAEGWDSYFCNVNGILASIALDLDLRGIAPDKKKPNLLWVWVYMKSPREDGLSSRSEFQTLCAIEDELTKVMTDRCSAVVCGRITTNGRREFYYYAPGSEPLAVALQGIMDQFPGYEFEHGWKFDPKWTQYVEVLYPSEEDRQRMENRKVLDALERKGDTLQTPRDVWHWIYLRTNMDREQFRGAVIPLEYRIQSEFDRDDSEFPKGICIVRFQLVKPGEINDAVIELFHRAKGHNGDYDGWETQVISD